MAGKEGGGGRNGAAANYQKSYFDVLGLCCSSEVSLIEKILHSLDGVVTVSVIVPSRTVIVVHDSDLVSQVAIVKALNQARLEATVRAYGKGQAVRHWPSPYTIACGVLLTVSFLKPVYRPLQWLAVAAVAAGLPPILLRAYAAIRRFTLDVNILMLIAVAGSMALRDYWEAGAIVFLFTIAEWLESRASYKATAVMSALMSMAPQKAVLAETGEVVDANQVKVSTVLAVKAGEVIPIDGVVVDGRSEVDESSLTGESFPVPKQPQSQVWASTLNINGYLSVKTTALAENSAVAKMTRLVEEAQNSKSRTHRLIDTCAKYYTPVVVLAAALLAVVPVALKVHNVRHWLRLALVLLVSACPCALVLSTPIATFCALTRAAKTGLLVKGGDFLEALAKTKVVAFDKTGTITRGEFTVMEFQTVGNDISMRTLLYWVSSIESKSSHPMAAALADYARSYSVEPKSDGVNEFHIYPGEGIYGEIDGKPIYIGNQRIAARAGCVTVPDVGKEMKGMTVGYIFAGAEPIGVFSLSDTCRTGAGEAIRGLKRMSIKTAMLTGDTTAAAMFAQNQLGNALDMVHAELLPEDKVRIVRDLKTKEGSTVMVGDGMNDAPALAMADVGISMGISGSAVAIETSHITMMSNDVRKIPDAIHLGKRTHSKIIQNIFLSVVTKAAILALAFAGHPLLWAAILSDVGTCLLVIFNSMLLLKTSHGKQGNCCGLLHKGHSLGDGVKYHGRDARGSANSGGTSSPKCCFRGGGCDVLLEEADEAREVGKCSSNVAACVSVDSCVASSQKCCSRGGGCGEVLFEAADETRAVPPRAVGKCSSNVAAYGSADPCIASSQNCCSRGGGGGGGGCDELLHQEANNRHDSHSISVHGKDGHHESRCNPPGPGMCTVEEQQQSHCWHEEQPVVHDVCGHKNGEIKEGHVSCEKQIVCTAACHSHRNCRDFRRRPVAACCRSGGPCSGSPQLKEIITE